MRIGIMGCAGRMGRLLVQTVTQTSGCVLAGATVSPGCAWVGHDVGGIVGGKPLGVLASSFPDAVFKGADVVIDFTTSDATRAHLAVAVEHKVPLVIGTTGLTPDDMAALDDAAAQIPVLQAANMSLGVALLAAMVKETAARLGPDFDIEILEMHHKHKVDAPSGTALALGRAAAAGRQVALDAVAVRTRDGKTGPRPVGSIGFATLRGGDVAGEHTVYFAGEGERLELTHKASSRQVFATGAVRAAQWLVGKPAGRYGIADVLGVAG